MQKNFVSELDQFLADFDTQHPEKSASQKASIKKHQRIAKLRDDPEAAKKLQDKIWGDF